MNYESQVTILQFRHLSAWTEAPGDLSQWQNDGELVSSPGLSSLSNSSNWECDSEQLCQLLPSLHLPIGLSANLVIEAPSSCHWLLWL